MSSRYMGEDFPFMIMRIVHDAENSPDIHDHEFIELIYVVRGAAQHVFEGTLYDLQAGDVFIINPGEMHTFSITPGSELEIINCLFLPHLIPDALLLELDSAHAMDYFYIHPFLDHAERFYHRLNLRGVDAVRVLGVLETMRTELQAASTGYQTIIRLQMIELLLLLSRYYGERHFARFGATDARAKEALRMAGYLERNYHQKIALPELAALFNVSVRQLNRLFREQSGCSVLERLQQIRIERAKTLLEETQEKVVVIAGLVGYEDPAFFSKLFARQVGCAPGQYRARLRSGVRQEG